MWQLSPEQGAALAQLQRERDLMRLREALATAFPATAQRAGERLGALVDLGVARGQAHGLTHLLALARYLACWFVWGTEFDNKPGFEWARDILGADARDQGVKVFQLCRRSREELARPGAPGAIGAESFDAAIAGLDAALGAGGALGTLLPRTRLRLGAACDIDVVEVGWVEASPMQLYRVEQGQWRRAPMLAERESVRIRAGDSGRPEALHVLSSCAQDMLKLRVRTRADFRCDADMHPLVAMNGPQGPLDWRGRDSADQSVALCAAPPAPRPADALQPMMAAEGAVQDSLLSFGSCGLRDHGPALGSFDLRLRVHAREQHLLAWRREAGAVMSWPDARPADALPAPRVRIERDGLALDATRWQAGFAELDRALVEGLGRLANAWDRESGVDGGRLQAQPRLLCGSAALTWGWAEAPRGPSAPAYHRVVGQFDVMACQLDLLFSGTLNWQGSSTRLSLACAASQPLQAAWERGADDGDLVALLQAAQLSFSLPFTLALESVATPDAAVANAVGPVQGALVGSCGLRPRGDGAGLQWFARLEVDPVSVMMQLHDPITGLQQCVRPLLPATKLLD